MSVLPGSNNYSVRDHIGVNHGEYDPHTPEGQHVLTHELAHVRQQTGGAVSILPQEGLELEIDPDPALEREAEETAQRVMQGGELGIQRLADTDVHVQRIPEGKALEALALFDLELWEGNDSDHRRKHNEHQYSYLKGVAQDVVEKKDFQDDLDLKQQVQEASNPDPVGKELSNRGDESIADLKNNIEELEGSISSDLEDVALTEDQMQRLYGGGESDKWDKASWTTVKFILVSTGVSQLVEMAQLASAATTAADASSQAAGFDVNKRAVETIGTVKDDLKNGELTSLDDLKDIWRQTNGTLEDRAEQIEEEIREGIWYDQGDRPDKVESREE